MGINTIDDATYYQNTDYLSAHSFMDYLDDPVLFWIKNHSDLEEEESRALINGTLFHAFMESENAFYEAVEQYEDTFIKKGRDFPKDETALSIIQAGDIETLEIKYPNDFGDMWEFVLKNWTDREKIWDTNNDWEREVILTADVHGVPFKGKLDKLKVDKENECGYILDYKTLRLEEKYQLGKWWNVETETFEPMSFIQKYNYDLQMTVYRHLVSENYGIPFEKVFVQFGLLVKSGKKGFIPYRSNYIRTKPLKAKDLDKPRFDGKTADGLLKTEAQKAYDLLQSEEIPQKYQGYSMMYRLYHDKPDLIDVDNVHL